MMDTQKPLLLIVEDNPTNIDVLVNTLKDIYRLGIVKNGLKALEYVDRYMPDLILLDIMMPEMDGYEVCQHLKSSLKTKDIPVIFITAMDSTKDKNKGFELGAVDYITKPFHSTEVRARVKTHLSLKKMREDLNAQNIILEKKVEEKTAQLQNMFNATIKTMALTIEIRDPYTAGHQERVAKLACAIAEKMQLQRTQIEAIKFAGLLHDIGKIRIPVSILNRTGQLLDAEMEMIRSHSMIGYEILKNIPFPWPIADIVVQHHERLDGSGYPYHLVEKDLLLESKIITVADVTEAQSSYRPYRPALGIETALTHIIEHRGVFYDAAIVDICCDLFRKDNFKFV